MQPVFESSDFSPMQFSVGVIAARNAVLSAVHRDAAMICNRWVKHRERSNQLVKRKKPPQKKESSKEELLHSRLCYKVHQARDAYMRRSGGSRHWEPGVHSSLLSPYKSAS